MGIGYYALAKASVRRKSNLKTEVSGCSETLVIKCHAVVSYLRIPQSSFKHPEELKSHRNTTCSSVPLPEVTYLAFLCRKETPMSRVCCGSLNSVSESFHLFWGDGYCVVSPAVAQCEMS